MPTKVALIAPNTASHRTAEETLALGYLASVLRCSGYVVTVIDGWLRNSTSSQIVNMMRDNVPDVVGISCYRSNLDPAKELLAAITTQFGHIPTICGGYGPTFHDTDFLEAGFSVAVRGEGEHVIVPLITAIINQRPLDTIPGISFLRDGACVRTVQTSAIQDLDLISLPARDETPLTMKRKNPVHVCTSRGCEAHCSFCSIYAFARETSKANRWRHRSIQNICDELLMLQELYGVTHVKFVDDSFLEPPREEQWAAEFAESVLRNKISLRFRTQVRADRLTEDIVASLRQAGWFATSVGIENAAPSALKRMRKSATVQDNWRALELLHRHGIYVQMGMILFDEATTMEELELNYLFLAQHDWVVTKGIFTEMFASAGTPYTRRLSKAGLLQTGRGIQNYHYEVQQRQVSRVYHIMKEWHKSHAEVYDWVIDSISAPKVLPDEGYALVHRLCRQLTLCDLEFFRYTLDHVKSTVSATDDLFVAEAIAMHVGFYNDLQQRVQNIYHRFDLVYDGILNPFLT